MIKRFSAVKGDTEMLSHIILFRGYIFGQKKKTGPKNQYPYSPPEWAAFNRALYQRRPRFSH
jgi:hypothetical protein